jgi:hypothetical protein
MSRILLALPLIVGFIQETDVPDWKPFVPKGGGFSVLLPLTPTEHKQRLKTSAGPITVTLFIADEKKIECTFVVGYSQYPEGSIGPRTAEKRLDNARDGAVASAKGKLKSEKVITLDGHPGRELEIESAKGMVRTRLVAVKNRLYQTMVVGSASLVRGKEAEHFLKSFKLSKDKD